MLEINRLSVKSAWYPKIGALIAKLLVDNKSLATILLILFLQQIVPQVELNKNDIFLIGQLEEIVSLGNKLKISRF